MHFPQTKCPNLCGRHSKNLGIFRSLLPVCALVSATANCTNSGVAHFRRRAIIDTFISLLAATGTSSVVQVNKLLYVQNSLGVLHVCLETLDNCIWSRQLPSRDRDVWWQQQVQVPAGRSQVSDASVRRQEGTFGRFSSS